jgi:hypothetical protein
MGPVKRVVHPNSPERNLPVEGEISIESLELNKTREVVAKRGRVIASGENRVKKDFSKKFIKIDALKRSCNPETFEKALAYCQKVWDKFKDRTGECRMQFLKSVIQAQEMIDTGEGSLVSKELERIGAMKSDSLISLRPSMKKACERLSHLVTIQKGIRGEIQQKDWVGSLNENLLIKDLLLPGTHDSGAIRDKAKKATKIVNDWAGTQRLSITDQLNSGIRGFDLRVAFNPQEEKYYISHTYTYQPLEDVLKEITSFIEKHPKEILQIEVKPDWGQQGTMPEKAEKESNKNIKALFEAALGTDRLISAKEYKYSLKEAWENGKNYRLGFDANNCSGHKSDFLHWENHQIWFTESNREGLKQKHSEFISELQKSWEGELNSASFVINPDAKTIVSGIFTGENIRTISQETNADLLSYIAKEKETFQNLKGVIAIDNPDDAIVHSIIALNLTKR